MFAANHSAAPNGAVFIEDAFSVHTYTGNGGTQTISNGIDLAGKGGLVWIKNRTTGSTSHSLYDTVRGALKSIHSNATSSQATDGSTESGVTSFSSTGFVTKGVSDYWNASGNNFVSFTFRKCPKFFDVVTYTGDGASSKTISHSLGQEPGMIIVKSLTQTADWHVYHRSLSANNVLYLNLTNASALNSTSIQSNPTSTSFTVGGDAAVNGSGASYVAYLFAHDTSTDGLIQCGSFTTDASGNATVTVPWTVGAQYAMIKCSSTTGDWEIYDNVRTAGFTGNDARLRANLSNAEDAVTRISASGTSVMFSGLSASATYVYKIIRARKP